MSDTDAIPVPPVQPDAAPDLPLAVPEVGGRTGLDPTRYGDWENKGIAVDF